MTLSSFIETQREQILETWEQDALDRMPGSHRANISLLRDSLGDLLEAIGRDLEAASRTAPAPLDRAHAETTWSHVEAVAAKHGAGRAREGITLKETVPEFPALRSCVARLWRQSLPSATVADLEDLIRFDEAVDVALAQSVSEFTDRLNRSREMFLGILGHDLRDPLSTILMAAKVMREEGFDCSKARDMAGRIVGTGERMRQLVVDLLDLARTRQSGQMPIRPHDVDLGAVIQAIVDEFKTVHPERDVRVRLSGNLHGSWDDKRMGQALENLLSNAHHHGAPDKPIDVAASASESEVVIAVHNEGPPIPEAQREHLFEPLSSGSRRGTDEDKRSHLGLGLYIARAIVAGHRGRIDYESEPKRGTTFTCHLPKGGAPTAS